MNWAHVHLIINHFPVIGSIFSLALFAYGVIAKSDEIKKLGLAVFVLIALITVPVYLTGGAAEKTVKNLPGVTDAFIGRHEELASLAMVVIELLGAMAAVGLFLYRRSGVMPRWLLVMILIGALVAVSAAGLTANLGGQIRHTEIR